MALFVSSFAALTVQHAVVVVFAIALLGCGCRLMIVASVTLRQLELLSTCRAAARRRWWASSPCRSRPGCRGGLCLD
ncbi:hypothetical protein ACX1DX_13950 [Tessaracoccus sp. Y36]